MFRLPVTAAVALSICSVLASPTLRAAAEADSTVVARVGDTKLTAAEIRSALQNLDPKVQAAAAEDPNSLSQVVRVILTQRLVLKEALAKKWDQNPAVTDALSRLRENAIVQTYLESVSAPPSSFPSDSEVQAAYDANKSQLLVPRQYRLAQIFIKSIKSSESPEATAKAEVKLDSVKKALAKHDADFAAVARAESDEPTSAEKGGEIGWVAENSIQPEIRTQLGSLTKGTVSTPVRLDDGWHIIKVLDVKEPYTPTLQEIRPQLVQQMRANRARANSQQYLAKLVQDNPVQIDELNLSKVLK